MTLRQVDPIKSKKALLIGLSLSLALNIFTISLLGGAFMGKDVLSVVAARGELRAALKDLPASKQMAFKDILHDHVIPNLQQLKIDTKQNTGELAQHLTDPALTRDVVESDFARIRETDIETRAKNQAYYVDFIMSLSPDERRSLADGVQRVLK